MNTHQRREAWEQSQKGGKCRLEEQGRQAWQPQSPVEAADYRQGKTTSESPSPQQRCFALRLYPCMSVYTVCQTSLSLSYYKPGFLSNFYFLYLCLNPPSFPIYIQLPSYLTIILPFFLIANYTHIFYFSWVLIMN